MNEIAIRPAMIQDVQAILSLDRAIDNLPHWSEADYRAATAGVAAQPPRCLMVAESDACLVGLAAVAVHGVAGERWAELETIGVSHAMQRRGVGRRLCRAVMEWCREQDITHIDLEVRSRGAGAVALYRELGFEVEGRRPAYYSKPGDDALLMRLALKREIPEG